MKNRKKDTRWMALLAMMVAVELVLVATGIGLIPLPVIKATTLHIPVILGAVLLGAGRRDHGGGVRPELHVDQYPRPRGCWPSPSRPL